MRATEFVTELNMSPGKLQQFAKSDAAVNIKAGFEAELAFTGLTGSDPEDGSDNDYSYDVDISRSTTIDDITEFFDVIEYDYEVNKILDEHDAYVVEQYDNYWSKHESSVREKVNNQHPDLYELSQEGDTDAEEELDDFVRERITNMYDDDAPTVGEYLLDNHIKSMKHVHEVYGFRWPNQISDSDWSKSAYEVAETIEFLTGTDCIVHNEYHESAKESDKWYVEPDSTISANNDDDNNFTVEVVSPAMPLLDMIPTMEKVLNKLIKEYGAYTNKSTGLHIGISLPYQAINGIDYVKLALFLGDSYVLNTFQRLFNHYTKPSIAAIKSAANDDANIYFNACKKLRNGMLHIASQSIQQSGKDKYVSINIKPSYVEFRSMGNDYLGNLQKVSDMVLRFARAYAVASDPNAERKEYAKKLYKLFNIGPGDDLAPFIQYTTGIKEVDKLFPNGQTGNVETDDAFTGPEDYIRTQQIGLKKTLANRQGKIPGQPQLARSPKPNIPGPTPPNPKKPQPTDLIQFPERDPFSQTS